MTALRIVRTVKALVEASHAGSSLVFAVMVALATLGARAEVVVIAAATTLAGTASGFLMNEVRDVELDRLQKPYRPIPSGRLTTRAGTVWFVVFYVIACTGAVTMSAWVGAGLVMVAYVVIGVAYTPAKYR